MANTTATLLGVLVLAIGVAVTSKPERNDFAPALAQLVVDETPQSIRAAFSLTDSLEELAVVNPAFAEECFSRTQRCALFFRGAMALTEDDFVIGRSAMLERGGVSVRCYGALNTWKCWFSGAS
ncbi:MAG: hypothetical protein AAGM38_00225 [Pseudomonadota bacterium]